MSFKSSTHELHNSMDMIYNDISMKTLVHRDCHSITKTTHEGKCSFSGHVAELGGFLAAGGGEELGGKLLGRRQSLGDQLTQTRKAI